MNYLQLCQALRQEMGYSGDGPSAVTGQTGQLKKIVDWVARAWRDIQLSRPNWLWMRTSFSLSLAADTGDYTGSDASLSDLDRWDTESLLIYLTATGVSDQRRLTYLKFPNWAAAFEPGRAARATNYPFAYTILDDNSLRFEPIPDDTYTVTGRYWKTPTELTGNTDTPAMPTRHHMIIVYKAMQYAAPHEGDAFVLGDAMAKYQEMLFALEREQLPKWNQEAVLSWDQR